LGCSMSCSLFRGLARSSGSDGRRPRHACTRRPRRPSRCRLPSLCKRGSGEGRA
jgi:hypothetical protein